MLINGYKSRQHKRQETTGLLLRLPSTTSIGEQSSDVLGVEGRDPTIIHEVLRSPGQPLDPATRAYMKPRFGHDFSQVRVHTDNQATESARSVNALAYTVGQDVVFRAEHYSPGSPLGRRLLMHELTHVIQQSNNVGNLPSTLQIESTNSPLEQEARTVSQNDACGSTATLNHVYTPIVQLQANPSEEASGHQVPDRFDQLTDPSRAGNILQELNPDLVHRLGRYCRQNCPSAAASVEHYLRTGDIQAAHCSPIGESSGNLEGYAVSALSQSMAWRSRTDGARDAIWNRTREHGQFVVVEGDRGSHPPNGLTRYHYFVVVNIRDSRFVVDGYLGRVYTESEITGYISYLQTRRYRLAIGDFEARPLWRGQRP